MYPSDPFGPRDPKRTNATHGKTKPRDCLVPRRLSFDVNLRAVDSGEEKAELTFRWSLALLLLSLATTTVRDQSAKRSALGGGGPRY